MNRIVYKRHEKDSQSRIQLFVSESEFDRSISLFAKAAEGIKLVTTPSTVKETRYDTFVENWELKSVVLNEGLERLGELEGNDQNKPEGMFGNTKIKRITLPSTLQILGDNAFCQCAELKCVNFRNGSKLETIGRHCFSESGIETVTLPKTLKTVSASAFERCENLMVAQVEDSCEISLSGAGIPTSARVIFL